MTSLELQLEQSLMRQRMRPKSIQRKTESSLAPLRKISRIEKMADRNEYREVLECGHSGNFPVFGPQREYIPVNGAPSARRCEECTK